jgi:hypothetical protein
MKDLRDFLSNADVRDLVYCHPLRQFVASGQSMYPVFRDGQAIRLEPLSNGQLIPGRCYVYCSAGKPFLHRLARMQGQTAVFIGDGSASYEEVPVDRIVAQAARGSSPPLLRILRALDRFVLGLFCKSVLVLRLRRKLLYLTIGVLRRLR